MKRVVVSAISVLSPIARGYDSFAEALMDGVSGGKQVSLFDASSFPTTIAAEVPDFEASEPFRRSKERGKTLAYAGDPSEDRKTALGLAAALDLVDLVGENVLSSCALHLGTGLSSATTRELEEDLLPYVGERGSFDRVVYNQNIARENTSSPWRHLTDEANRLIVQACGIQGASSSNFAACAASTQAIGRAFRDIQAGRTRCAIAGGMDSMIHPFGMISFMRLGALTTSNDRPEKASKPFDKNRDGFLIGEGAVMILLEELEHAQERGANILAELVGYGTSMDAYAVTAPHPEGKGALLAMRRALRDASLCASDMDYINAHGTGTALNDSTESRAIVALYEGEDEIPPVSSTKSMTGHLVAAAGALEFAACVAAVDKGFLPPSINIEELDPACQIPIVQSDRGQKTTLRYVMNNNFGFGGQNASLILRRWEGA